MSTPEAAPGGTSATAGAVAIRGRLGISFTGTFRFRPSAVRCPRCAAQGKSVSFPDAVSGARRPVL